MPLVIALQARAEAVIARLKSVSKRTVPGDTEQGERIGVSQQKDLVKAEPPAAVLRSLDRAFFAVIWGSQDRCKAACAASIGRGWMELRHMEGLRPCGA